MLESVQISNFAIIDSLNLEFDRGLTALTGETGAGKSILLDAIKLIAGDRADIDSVKADQEKAEISVRFDLGDHLQARKWLQQNEMTSAHECIIRRVVFANGRSKAYINGYNATLSQLKGLTQLMVDLHGQQAHQSLQKTQVQQQLLDSFMADHRLTADVNQKYSNWQTIKNQLSKIKTSSVEQQQRIDLLNLYYQELVTLNLVEGEIENLQNEYSRLSHAGLLLENSATILGILYDNDENTVQGLLAFCEQTLASQLVHDTALSTSHELISNALIQIQEASNELRNYQDSIDLAPERLDWLNQRIAGAQDLARKHHLPIEKLPGLALQFESELEALVNNEKNEDELRREFDQKLSDYLNSATQLSAKRQETALSLSGQITQVMQQLGMDGGQFSIQVDEVENENGFRASGINSINYLVSANPGQPLRPLSKVASGGELSRISLAIQVILCESSRIPTLIFDEVDSGIGGGIAEIIGKKLRWLGENRQVFCITHLAQVASQAHHHFLVKKIKKASDTTTEVIELSDEERLEEIARMLGGMTITEQTRAHASEMITDQG